MAPLRAWLDRRWTHAALLAALVALGLAVRLATWPWVFGGDEPHFVGDGDPLYQVLQAERLLDQGLASVWRDPGLNHPFGAEVPWPPLFAALLAGAGAAANGGYVPDRPTLEAAAMVVPALLGALMVLLVAFLGRALLGGRPWLDAALVLALLPSHAILACLGRPDQHALEPLLFGLVVLAAARLAGGGDEAGPGEAPGWRRPGALLALAVTLAFWNWNGSVLYLALLGGFAAALHLVSAPGEAAPGRTAARLAAALGAGAVLLAGSVALLAPTTNLFTAGLSGLTGLQPTLVAGTALACGALAAARRLRPAAGWPERGATAAGAVLLPAALLALLPWTRDGIGRGLTMLAASGWYRTILEFRPLLPSGLGSPLDDLSAILSNHGLTPLAVVAALPLCWRRLRAAAPGDRGPALLFGVTALFTLVIGWARNRFSVYLSVAEALSAALVAREAAAAVAARWPGRTWLGPAAGGALLALLVAPVLPSLPSADYAPVTRARYAELAPVARLAARVPLAPGREAVLAPWSHGHDVRYWSGRPVVSSPVGIEGGAGALEVDAAFHRATDEATAHEVLASRRVGLVLIIEPLDEVVSLLAFARQARWR
jgi:asparagine N-glycosylation enzyme membrane subunit Stt3